MAKLHLPPELLNRRIAPSHPHDAYFQTIFSLLPLAVEQLQFALPTELLQLIDLDSLELANRAYTDEVFGQHFSDLVYTARIKGGGSACICLLHEHKSNRPQTPVLAQIHRYQGNVLDYGARQQSGALLVVPIVLYHGAAVWEKETFESLYPGLPDGFRP
jgi:predicted transposase YdaD